MSRDDRYTLSTLSVTIAEMIDECREASSSKTSGASPFRIWKKCLANTGVVI